MLPQRSILTPSKVSLQRLEQGFMVLCLAFYSCATMVQVQLVTLPTLHLGRGKFVPGGEVSECQIMHSCGRSFSCM